jgi:transketolase
MSGILAGLSTWGRHLGVGSSYGAFLAPLGHIAARLHAIGSQARHARSSEPYHPMILVCAHAGLKTGEDGPTHADPQALQLLQENFPTGTTITLTPWDPQEIWPLLCAALAKRPATIAAFVTRPNETILDRARLGLAPAAAATGGLYLLRAARGKGDGTVVLQESGVAYAFLEGALPRLVAEGIDLNVYYVASAELFDMLPRDEQLRIWPEERAQEAIGITGFTLPTMHRWIRSEKGRAGTIHPFMKGHYPGSGAPERVLQEMGLDGEGLFRAVQRYALERRATNEAAGTIATY